MLFEFKGDTAVTSGYTEAHRYLQRKLIASKNTVERISEVAVR